MITEELDAKLVAGINQMRDEADAIERRVMYEESAVFAIFVDMMVAEMRRGTSPTFFREALLLAEEMR